MVNSGCKKIQVKGERRGTDEDHTGKDKGNKTKMF